ncbi:MAG: polysulfide reductase [Desulfuromonas sp.]|nr:MAG: polysulfide reductase [Desulfuromonas sp.]
MSVTATSKKLTLNEIERGLTERLLSGSPGYYVAVIITALMILAATAAGIYSMIVGHDHVYGVTREIPWGILIVAYVFFVVTSTGLCLVSSIGHVFGVESYMPIAKRSVFLSIATILGGFFVIAFEIKLPWRMAIYNVISPNLTSNIWWMGTLYGIYLVLMLFEYLFLNLDKHKPAVACGFGGSIAGIAAHSNLGAVFGLLMGREFWHGPYMSIYFIASAMMTGTAVIYLTHYLGYKINRETFEPAMEASLDVVRRLGILLICVIMFFTIWKMVAGVAGQPGGKYEAVMALVQGPYALNFWLFEVGFGLVFPLIIFILGRGKSNLMFFGSLIMIIGIFMMRYDLVIVGEIVPVYHELGVNEFKHLLHYTPSLYEIIITMGGFGVAGFLFLIGEKVFAGHKVSSHH